MQTSSNLSEEEFTPIAHHCELFASERKTDEFLTDEIPRNSQLMLYVPKIALSDQVSDEEKQIGA